MNFRRIDVAKGRLGKTSEIVKNSGCIRRHWRGHPAKHWWFWGPEAWRAPHVVVPPPPYGNSATRGSTHSHTAQTPSAPPTQDASKVETQSNSAPTAEYGIDARSWWLWQHAGKESSCGWAIKCCGRSTGGLGWIGVVRFVRDRRRRRRIICALKS